MTKQDPTVSVILPTYNRATLLPGAIQSVLNQDFDDFELIIIDDGSIDETSDVIASIGDPRVQYTRLEKNRGIGFARHEGISRSRGKLVGFIDSDDCWLPGKLGLQVRLFQMYPHIDLIFGDYKNINHITGGADSGFNQTKKGLRRLVVRKLEEQTWEVISGLPEAMLVSNFIATPTVMVKSEVFQRVGSFNTSLSGPEDFEFWWRAAVKGVRFAYIEQPLIERNKDGSSITARTVAFVPQYLRALSICAATTEALQSSELRRQLRLAQHRVWRSLIKEYALTGRRRDAAHAFRQSLRYGISWRAIMFFLASLGGPRR